MARPSEGLQNGPYRTFPDAVPAILDGGTPSVCHTRSHQLDRLVHALAWCQRRAEERATEAQRRKATPHPTALGKDTLSTPVPPAPRAPHFPRR